jgi:hypothetical protein
MHADMSPIALPVEYVPASQAKHTPELVAPTPVLYLPAPQLTHKEVFDDDHVTLHPMSFMIESDVHTTCMTPESEVRGGGIVVPENDPSSTAVPHNTSAHLYTRSTSYKASVLKDTTLSVTKLTSAGAMIHDICSSLP